MLQERHGRVFRVRIVAKHDRRPNNEKLLEQALDDVFGFKLGPSVHIHGVGNRRFIVGTGRAVEHILVGTDKLDPALSAAFSVFLNSAHVQLPNPCAFSHVLR